MLKRQNNSQAEPPLAIQPQPSRSHAATTLPDGPSITIFAIPKPFEGTIETIQRNAIRSWAMLGTHVELLLFGDDAELRSIANETGADVLPIRVSERGTPILSDAFQKAHMHARGDLLVYVNSDIVLGIELLEVVERLSNSEFESFLGIGVRTEYDVSAELTFESTHDVTSFLQDAARNGRSSSIICKDYFVFTRDLFTEIPDFRVGRANWDNWMVHHAKQKQIPVVSLTESLTAVHQTHGYEHVPGGRIAAYFFGKEARQNQRLGGGQHLVSGSTATWRLSSSGLLPIRQPNFEFVKDMPRFLSLIRNLMFTRYFFVISALFV